jgi:thymidine kinase
MKCGADAPFTARTSSEVEIQVIGGADKYVAVCRACHDVETSIKHIPKIDDVFKRSAAVATTSSSSSSNSSTTASTTTSSSSSSSSSTSTSAPAVATASAK